MRIVFFGTPEFAAVSLRALLRERFTVAGVVTQPDRPQGRSRSTLVPPPVKTLALASGLPVLQPARPVGDLFLAALRRLEADLGVVVAYGHILRPEVLAVPPRGMINVHASLLPRFRGAAPVQHAILAGDAETGVSIMAMEAGLDSGPVLHRVATPIAPDETGGSLTDRLAELGASALVEVLSLVAAGAARPQPQNHALATFAPKIDRALARIDWSNDAPAIARQIRAFDPVPGAWTLLGSDPVKLFSPKVSDQSGEPGAVLAAGERLLIACGSGSVMVREVQPAGRSRMSVDAWVRGRGIDAGRRLA
ncbi:MAG TPA: methionyl-tRNA formyltransferase [Gemmatimonadales bacterium]|nr:methionyl-tRNA formyltransferase [Gemmatimonadales bacterium]